MTKKGRLRVMQTMSAVNMRGAFLAQDVYRHWEKRLAEAKTTVTVFTPFFDNVLLRVLASNPAMSANKITLVTDFVPEHLLRSPAQLHTIKRAMGLGISVRSLARLHAKILLVDDAYAIVGSQNFTRAGRKNREASVAPQITWPLHRFIKTLQAWRLEATPIDEALVDALLTTLEPRLREQKRLLKDTADEFEATVAAYNRQKHAQRLRELEEQSQFKLAQKVAYATVSPIGSSWDTYDSLQADQGYTLTRWIRTRASGEDLPYLLRRLRMYPILVTNSWRMGFARIGKTRITYVRDLLMWSNHTVGEGVRPCKVSIRFPKKDTAQCNITVTYEENSQGTCEFGLFFSGDTARLVRVRFKRGRSRSATAAFQKTMQSTVLSEQGLAKFFGEFFDAFRYQRLDLERKNIGAFLGSGRFRLSAIEYQETPYLLIRKIEG
jgi:hypothetical protein